MNRVLLLDVETTGTDPARDHAIEVGAVLFSVKHGCAVQSFSCLIGGVDATNEAEHVNRIPVGTLVDEGREATEAWDAVSEIVAGCDAVLAHSADFDRSFSPPWLRDNYPWICTMQDLDWPRQTKPGQSLVSLALAHDLGVATAHRALADCDLIARLLTRVREMGVDLDAFLARGMRPKAMFQALVSYDDRKLASDAGFRWNEPGREKMWTRSVAIDDVAGLPFPTRRIA